MRMLISKIYASRLDEQKAEMERFYGEKGAIGWGHQIRSYVFQPYRMVKDSHRRGNQQRPGGDGRRSGPVRQRLAGAGCPQAYGGSEGRGGVAEPYHRQAPANEHS